MSYKLHLGDCLEILVRMPDNSVDSIVTDPPYGLSFMNHHWDYAIPGVDIWKECFRVLKPGGHLLSFAGTRTQHRMAVNIEDAGFEIRDMIAWVYGSGFPKSLDVSKAIDKALGVEGGKGAVTGKSGSKRNSMAGDFAGGEYHEYLPAADAAKQWQGWGTALKPALEPITVARKPLACKTVAANVLQHGTGAINIDACRVPLQGDADTAAFENNHRVTERLPQSYDGENLGLHDGGWKQRVGEAVIPVGRWPANIIHDGSEEVAAAFPQTQSGTLTPDMNVKASSGWSGGSKADRVKSTFTANAGSAARFFYAAKASRKDRNSGCEGVLTWENADLNVLIHSALSQTRATSEIITRLQVGSEWVTTLFGSSTSDKYQTDTTYTIKTVLKLTTELTTSNSCQGLNIKENILVAIKTLQVNGLNLAESVANISLLIANTTNEKTVSVLGAVNALLKTLSEISVKGKLGNAHSTVKPTDLMRYLCKLVTPPNGIVLDPFMGSGSTGKAALMEGFRFIGIDQDTGYMAIARARIEAAAGEDLV